MYLNKIKLQNKIKRFKFRKQIKMAYNYNYFLYKTNLKFFYKFFCRIYTRFLMYLELKIYKIFFLKIRKIIRKKKLKAFVNICCNHNFSKKSKNSRMGKGKGKFCRFIYRTTSFKPIFTFFNVSSFRVLKLCKFLNKKSKNRYFIFY